MQKHEQQIKSILEKGFSRLVLDEKTVSMEAEQIIIRAKEVQSQSKRYTFPTVNKNLFYAIAALLVLCCIPAFFYWNFFKGNNSELLTRHIKSDLNQVTIISAADDSYQPKSCENVREKIVTNSNSQLLLAAGMRTRALLFEKSCIQVEQADSMKTTIKLDRGLLSVNIAGDGKDTISVITNQASFTQIGTFFTIYTDSVHGSVLQVYHGKVRVQDRFGTDLIIEGGKTWNSNKRQSVTDAVHLFMKSEIDQVFKDNKIENRLIWDPEVFLSTKKKHRDDSGKRNLKYQEYNSDTLTLRKQTQTDLLCDLKMHLSSEDFNSAADCIKGLQNPVIIDSVYKQLINLAQYNTSVFKYHTALNVLDLIIEGKPFGVNQREAAWMQGYLIHKEYLNSPPQKRLEMVYNYQQLFPDGKMSEEVASEEIHLGLLLKKYSRTITKMEKYIKKYPHHYNSDYYCYLLASLIREKMQNEKDALNFYKAYRDSYPHGKYEEDALYWIIQLSLSNRDYETAEKMKIIYKEKFPQGRWNKEVSEITSLK